MYILWTFNKVPNCALYKYLNESHPVPNNQLCEKTFKASADCSNLPNDTSPASLVSTKLIYKLKEKE